jgi:hypothetical protein
MGSERPMSGQLGESDPGSRRPSFGQSMVRRSPYIRWNRHALKPPGWSTMDHPMSLLTTSIESSRPTRWNVGLVALALLGVSAIALALMLPNSITP